MIDKTLAAYRRCISPTSNILICWGFVEQQVVQQTIYNVSQFFPWRFLKYICQRLKIMSRTNHSEAQDTSWHCAQYSLTFTYLICRGLSVFVHELVVQLVDLLYNLFHIICWTYACRALPFTSSLSAGREVTDTDTKGLHTILSSVCWKLSAAGIYVQYPLSTVS